MSNQILLVEDSRTQALRIQLELARHGLKLMIARDGISGLEAARTQSPEVIVLDVDLPDLDGYAVCHVRCVSRRIICWGRSTSIRGHLIRHWQLIGARSISIAASCLG